MGGGVAARFAELYPERVTKLILVDAADMQTTFGDHSSAGIRLARMPIINRLLLHITPRSLVVEGLNDGYRAQTGADRHTGRRIMGLRPYGRNATGDGRPLSIERDDYVRSMSEQSRRRP